MYIYLTSGTGDFLEQVKNKYPNEHMILIHGDGNSVLIHETEGKTVFATPRKFEVLDSVNELEERGRFLERSRAIENEPGFVAFRLLRPIKSDTYIVMTQWNGPHSFEAWKSSRAFESAHAKRDDSSGVSQQNIFSAASYVTTYSAMPNEDTE